MIFVTYVERRPGYVEPDVSMPERKGANVDSLDSLPELLATGNRTLIAVEHRGQVHQAPSPNPMVRSADEYLPGLLYLH